MRYMAQIQRTGGEWVQQGPLSDSRVEAEERLAWELAHGAACDGRDDAGNLLPNNPTRIVEVGQ